MFSGLVEATSDVISIEPELGGIRLNVSRPKLFDDIELGDSIALNGCCLTVIHLDGGSISFQAGTETLSKTSLGQLQEGSVINVERALALGDRLGGHLVTGHVDGLGRLAARIDQAEWSDMTFEASYSMLRQMVAKGSITIDGVSLTLVSVSEADFSVALIPHTLKHTTLGQLSVGDAVNLETDLLAKYVQRQLDTRI